MSSSEEEEERRERKKRKYSRFGYQEIERALEVNDFTRSETHSFKKNKT